VFGFAVLLLDFLRMRMGREIFSSCDKGRQRMWLQAPVGRPLGLVLLMWVAWSGMLELHGVEASGGEGWLG
jgi:hypothetical protein